MRLSVANILLFVFLLRRNTFYVVLTFFRICAVPQPLFILGFFVLLSIHWYGKVKQPKQQMPVDHQVVSRSVVFGRTDGRSCLLLTFEIRIIKRRLVNDKKKTGRPYTEN